MASIPNRAEKCMKRTVRCIRCSSCARVAGCGFVALDRLWCTERGRWVDADDGCTLGECGEPMTGVVPCEARIDGYKPAMQPEGW